MADFNFDFLHSYSPLKRALILSGIIAIITGVFIYFIYMPKLEELKKLERKLKQAQVKLHQTQQIASQLPQFEAEIEKLNLAFKKALNKLPDNKEIPSLLLKITKLGKDAKLSFNLFQPLKTRNKDFYAEVPINIEVQGSYHAVGRFFSQLCAMPRIVNIFGYNLGSYQLVKGEDILKTKFQAVTYTFIDAPPPKKGKKKKKRR
ncbi:MAG: type 4a pilus biogenesis protein PilO [Pseudomonadota bacterium]|nr:type 4a pilus biogenesis protein PilO [Pseudomonadota bacterium]